MQKKVVVLSLGGSLIIPDEIDSRLLKEFKKIILKNTKKYKFIIVCGGGSIARKYIKSLRENKIDEIKQSMIGISCTRTNARFMSYFFNKDQSEGIPQTLGAVEKYISKSDVVFCGALEYKPHQTSDATAVEIAKHFNSIFINLTNVNGLYDKNPLKHKDAKFISEISFEGLYKMSNAKKYSPGQNFIIDQTASGIILKNKIISYIVGKDMKQLDNLLNNRKFKGTIVD